MLLQPFLHCPFFIWVCVFFDCVFYCVNGFVSVRFVFGSFGHLDFLFPPLSLFMFLILFLPFPSLLLPFHLSLFVSLVFLSSSIYFASCHFSLPFNLLLPSLTLFSLSSSTSLPLLFLSYSSSSLHFSFISFIYALLSPLPPPHPSLTPPKHTHSRVHSTKLLSLLSLILFPLSPRFVSISSFPSSRAEQL